MTLSEVKEKTPQNDLIGRKKKQNAFNCNLLNRDMHSPQRSLFNHLGIVSLPSHSYLKGSQNTMFRWNRNYHLVAKQKKERKTKHLN